MFEQAIVAGHQPLVQPDNAVYTAQNGLRWQSDPAPPTEAEQTAAEWQKVEPHRW